MSDVSSILTGTGLAKSYSSGLFNRQKTLAVSDVDIAIRTGEIYALVGESGSGKTTLGKLLLKLIELSSGSILYRGDDITNLSGQDLIGLRKKMQVIPQHPEDSFNPRWKLSWSILEPSRIHKKNQENGGQLQMLTQLLSDTGLNPDYAERYPHQLSGGELQRAAIARALLLEPEFILCDEPTSMLDVSVQAAIINVLLSLQKRSGITILFITHDLTLAAHIADRIGVMYGGQIVEEGADILSSPMHPYTRSIVTGVGHEGTGCHQHNGSGECPFYHHCPVRSDHCLTNPPMKERQGRAIRCHHPQLEYN